MSSRRRGSRSTRSSSAVAAWSRRLMAREKPAAWVSKSRRDVVVMNPNLEAGRPRSMVRFHGENVGHCGSGPAPGADRDTGAGGAGVGVAGGGTYGTADGGDAAAVLAVARRGPGDRTQHRRGGVRRSRGRGVVDGAVGAGHPGRLAAGFRGAVRAVASGAGAGAPPRPARRIAGRVAVPPCGVGGGGAPGTVGRAV